MAAATRRVWPARTYRWPAAALTMDRCYRPAFSDDVALAMLHAERGRAFCPHLVDTFMADVPRMMAVRDHVKRIKLSFADLATGIHLP